MIRWHAALALGQALLPASLTAQLGEVHLGVLAGYGTAGAYGPGAGVIVGVAAGRLAYVGARWTYFFGDTGTQSDTSGTFTVEDRVQMFAADLGLQYPAGPVEIVAGLTIGAIRLAQRATPVAPGTGATTAEVGVEFLAAPNVSVQLRALGLLVIPEVMYTFTGAPDLRWPVDRRGPVFSLRVVLPFEVQRIRR